MNLFLARDGHLSAQDLSLGQAVADLATIGLLKERAVQQPQLFAEQVQRALNGRVVIEQAKGMLTERHGLPTETAFAALRGHARRSGQALLTVATHVSTVASTLQH